MLLSRSRVPTPATVTTEFILNSVMDALFCPVILSLGLYLSFLDKYLKKIRVIFLVVIGLFLLLSTSRVSTPATVTI